MQYSRNKKSYDNCIRKVQKWLSGSDEPKNFDELEKICKILDCDSSYLFDDKPVANFNNKKVAEWLGLDEIVVSNIKGYDNDIKLFMSLLVRANEYDNKFGDILHDFIEIMLILNQNSSHTTVTIENDITGEKESIKGTAAFDYILSAIKNMMEPIFYKVSILGIDINRKKYDMELEKRNLEREKELEIINYYNTYDEDGRLFRDNSHQIEWLTTMRYFDDIIPASSKIFDGCAGTGNYAFKLAEQGHRVVASDIVPHNIS